MGKKSIYLHGHSHGRLKPMPRQFDVGVDARSLRPVLSRLCLRHRGRVDRTVAAIQPQTTDDALHRNGAGTSSPLGLSLR